MARQSKGGIVYKEQDGGDSATMPPKRKAKAKAEEVSVKPDRCTCATDTLKLISPSTTHDGKYQFWCEQHRTLNKRDKL